jgi:predicted transcriptional regulator of viral defense system
LPRPLDLEAFLADSPVFTLAQLAGARGAQTHLAAARNQLKRHLASGRVKAVARELYAAVPPGLDAGRFQPDPFLVAAAARPEGVFAYHSALELLGAAHSMWHECTLHCDRRRAALQVGATRILFLSTPTALKRRRLQTVATRTIPRLTQHLIATGPERTLVEGLRQPHRVGGLEELVESVSGFPLLDFRILERVLELYDEKTLWAAAGWLTETYREVWSTPDSFLDACRRRRSRQNQYVVRGLRGGRLLRDWRLIVPAHLVGSMENRAAHA